MVFKNPQKVFREREFDLRFGIRRTHEILEARNSPETGKCFFLVRGQDWYARFALTRNLRNL